MVTNLGQVNEFLSETITRESVSGIGRYQMTSGSTAELYLHVIN
jgi:hypothetical protein